VNKDQWGINDDGAAAQAAAIQQAKELAAQKAKEGGVNAREGGVKAARRLGTQSVPGRRRLGTTRAVGTQGVASLSKAAPANGSAQAAATDSQAGAKQAILQSAGKKSWMSEAGGREITNAEVLAVVARTGGLSTDQLTSYLTIRGYTGDVLDAMLAKCSLGQKGQLSLSQPEQDLEKAANMFAQADQYEEEAQKLEVEAYVFVEESRTLGPEILKLTESIDALKPEVKVFEWLPDPPFPFPFGPFGPRSNMADAQASLDVLVDKRKVLDERYEEIDGQAQEKSTNSRWDREDAGILRDNALKAMASSGKEDEDALGAAAKVIESAEESLKLKGAIAALEKLIEGSEALEKISLRPDRKASPSSLPGRLATVLSAPTSSSKQAQAAVSGEGGWMESFKFW